MIRRSIDLGKIMVTLADDVWNARTSYEILTAVYHNGDGYISRRDNIGVEPGTDDSVWYRIVRQGQIPEIWFDDEGNMYADDKLVTTVFADVVKHATEAVANDAQWKAAEEARAAAEAQRLTKEDERIAAEAERKASETNRRAAEEERIRKETIRDDNERGRVLAESEREGRFEEAMRQAASTMRKGDRGYSAYEIAVLVGGFEGTEEEWLESMVAGDPNAIKYTEQSLTDSQKAQARKNVGACSADSAGQIAPEPELLPAVLYAAQELTTVQRAQARENIGAGTSSFSGSYNDLQDKPEQITLSQDVIADKNSISKAPSSKAFYDDVHPAMAYSQPIGGMLPNVFYDLGVLNGGNVTFNLAAPLDASVVNHYFFVFRTGEAAPNVTWPSNIIGWINGGDPELEPYTHYEISIINGYAAFLHI